jgi:8-oxo-dGTP pyrophosphatase MutT (NUDIX family)
VLARVVGLTESAANDRLGLPAGALAYWVAALRECFEEAGILLAVGADQRMVAAERLARVAAHREALNRRERAFADVLTHHELCCPSTSWSISTTGSPRRCARGASTHAFSSPARRVVRRARTTTPRRW